MQIRVHFSVLVGVVLACIHPFLAGLMVAYGVLVVLHELGHAAAVRLVGARVTGIDLAPFGGVCRWEGHVSPVQRSLIAWGGVVVQAVVFVAAVAAVRRWGFPPPGFRDGLAYGLVLENAFIAFVNLVPVEPLDGGLAWRLFPLLLERRRRAALVDAALAPKAKEKLRPVVTDRAMSDEEIPEEMKAVVSAMLADAAKEARKRS